MENRHSIQMNILGKLLFAEGLTYTKMKPDIKIENNQFQYHLDKLLTEKLVMKDESTYQLTQKGKEFANSMKTEVNRVHTQGKRSARMVCLRGKGDNMEVIIYTRLKQPFYGMEGLFSGKIEFGEKVQDAAKRELLEETTLKGNFKLVSIEHWLTQDKKSGNLLEDKYFYSFVVTDVKGELKGCDEGEYRWIRIADIPSEVKKPFDSIEDLLGSITTAIEGQSVNTVSFDEYVHITNDF